MHPKELRATTEIEGADSLVPSRELLAYWTAVAEAFVTPLKANSQVSTLIGNSAVTGAFAEASVRALARTMLAQFRVSTGAIISAGDQRRDLSKIPQCDIIIWDPSELPGVGEHGEFALVPFHAARAIIEVKRTGRQLGTLLKQLDARRRRLPDRYQKNILGVVVSHPVPLFEGSPDPEWLQNRTAATPPATRLLLSPRGAADLDGVMVLVYFLAQLAGHGLLPKHAT